MRLNYETSLSGGKTVLCPYHFEHIEKYHEWMKCPFLLEMTGSEPLSYEEEVKMQQTWRDDEEKCTFILLSKELCEKYLIPTTDDKIENEVCNEPPLGADFIKNTLDAMIGDVNLFLSKEDNEESESVTDGDQNDMENHCDRRIEMKQAELDLMVAEENFRGKGIGKEAACMMMIYGAEKLGVRKFTVKIKEDNTASRHLFENVRNTVFGMIHGNQSSPLYLLMFSLFSH